MEFNYTTEKNVQIVIALLKAHGVKKIIASPGTTNVTFMGSVQNDSYFEIYSAADERSAAYIACGLAEESGEPVALSCTGATASRNYIPGLTEAFYRKLPIVAITSSQHFGRIGHNFPQLLDRSTQQKDIVKASYRVAFVHDEEEEWSCQANVNKVLLELFRDGGGPVLLDLESRYSPYFDVKTLPDVKVIRRITLNDIFPKIPKGRIAVYIGAHRKFTKELTEAIDLFCSNNNAVVFCDQTSNYKGKYRILSDIFFTQKQSKPDITKIDLLIHLGNNSSGQGVYSPKESWRVASDGEVRDTFKKLTFIFDMEEIDFFNYYNNHFSSIGKNTYYEECISLYKKYLSRLDDLPFSNIWIAQQLSNKIPENSVLHLGIVNTLRAWNLFEIPNSVLSYSNTGGFGIDGDVSSLIGASLYNQNKLYFGVLGDLAFFYDMNSIGNHCVGNNIRILVINNGRGTEFRLKGNPASKFGEDADKYMAAAGHYGNKSNTLLKHYSEDLGFKYLSASSKDEFLSVYEEFLNSEINDKPIFFEVFTDSEKESEALEIIRNLETDTKSNIKSLIKNVIGEENATKLKRML